MVTDFARRPTVLSTNPNNQVGSTAEAIAC